jgi:hypothetical protein
MTTHPTKKRMNSFSFESVIDDVYKEVSQSLNVGYLILTWKQSFIISGVGTAEETSEEGSLKDRSSRNSHCEFLYIYAKYGHI